MVKLRGKSTAFSSQGADAFPYDKASGDIHTATTETGVLNAYNEALSAQTSKQHPTLTKADAKAATCTEDGNNEYYICSRCGGVFKDEAGTQATTVVAETLKKLGHDWSNKNGICARCDAKCTEAHKPGTTCSVCHKYTSYPYVPGAPTYPATAPAAPNGTVTVSPANASKGETVTITTKPSEGYELGSIEVFDKNGDSLKLKDLGNGKYSFVMPDGKVSVEAEFVKTAATSFADVPANAYFADAVKWAVDKGVTNGLSDTMFGPYESCTRAQIVTFLWRAAGSPEPKTASSFTDVPASAYYAKAVAWAVENGITNGMTETTFAPNATCTRGQSVTFLYRALGKKVESSANFTDVKSDAFYADAINWAVANNVTNGTSNIIYFPRRYSCWRKRVEHFAAVAVNFCAVPLAARQAPETGCLPCKLSICFYLPWYPGIVYNCEEI